jgi:hypothetical protein
MFEAIFFAHYSSTDIHFQSAYSSRFFMILSTTKPFLRKFSIRINAKRGACKNNKKSSASVGASSPYRYI